MARQQIKYPNVLVVEGKDEELFFDALIEHMHLEPIQLWPMRGVSRLREQLKALRNAPGFAKVRSLGVELDADDDASAAFDKIKGALKAADLPVPEMPLESAEGAPKVTAMILPGGGRPGMLETLCLESVEGDHAIPCVQKYFDCLQEEDIDLPGNLPKARVKVFLASRKVEVFSASRVKPARRLGEAAQAGDWPFDHEAFEQVRAFLQEIAS